MSHYFGKHKPARIVTNTLHQTQLNQTPLTKNYPRQFHDTMYYNANKRYGDEKQNIMGHQFETLVLQL